MKKIVSITFTFLVITIFAFAQKPAACGTDELYSQRKNVNPLLKLLEDRADIEAVSYKLSFNKANGIIYIPVVFHIIHNDGFENISQAQIMNQIGILNQDFRKKAGTPGFSTDVVSSDFQIEFRLAQYDPEGIKSDGILRIKDINTSSADDGIKSLSYWDSEKYLNIWVVRTIDIGLSDPTGTVLGYAQFPWERASRPTTDGIVIRSDQIGIIGSGQTSQGGRTLTHEIGHWLGLFHTFQGGCTGGTSSNCAFQGDRVCDTPPVSEANFGCSTTKNSCNNDVPNLIDQVRNYMDYSNGTCMNTYTVGQKTRSYSNLTLHRNLIYGNGTNNVAYAGINPATGDYLAVTPATIKAPYFYGFESTNLTSDGWQLNNFNTSINGWRQTADVKLTGAASMMLRNFINATVPINNRDGFQSPIIDLTTVTDPYVEFHYAHAQRSTVNTDSLILLITPNFGMLEQRIFNKRNNEMATAPIRAEEFLPANNEWRKVSISLAPYAQYTNARFRFEFVNRRGNNIFIDNFSLTSGPTSIGENSKKDVLFAVYPNPFNEYTTISFSLQTQETVRIALTDITGREIEVIKNGLLPAGKNELILSKNGLSKGMYFIDFKGTVNSFSHKLLVN